MSKIEVKNEKMFKNKWQMIIYFLIFCVLIYLFILIGKTDFKKDISDNAKFSNEYSMVSKDNVFIYTNILDVHMIASGRKGIVLFGGSNKEWVGYYAKLVNQVAKEEGIDKVYYYNLVKDREQNNATYEDTVQLLKDYVTVNDLNKGEIYAPSILVVSKGKIIYFDSETSFVDGGVTPEVYWNNYNKNSKLNELRVAFKEYKEG